MASSSAACPTSTFSRCSSTTPTASSLRKWCSRAAPRKNSRTRCGTSSTCLRVQPSPRQPAGRTSPRSSLRPTKSSSKRKKRRSPARRKRNRRKRSRRKRSLPRKKRRSRRRKPRRTRNPNPRNRDAIRSSSSPVCAATVESSRTRSRSRRSCRTAYPSAPRCSSADASIRRPSFVTTSRETSGSPRTPSSESRRRPTTARPFPPAARSSRSSKRPRRSGTSGSSCGCRSNRWSFLSPASTACRRSS